MIVFILSAIDLLAGGLILMNVNFLLNILAVIIILKGFFSSISSIGIGYWFDWMGAVDILAGTSLFLFSFGLPAAFFSTIAWIVIFKGIYSITRYVFRF